MHAQVYPIALSARRARAILVIAIAVFVAQDWILTNEIGVSHEVVSLHAAPPSRQVVIAGDKAQIVDPCTAHHRIVFANGRPSTMLCAGGLAWPVLVAPYIGGVHYWPLQLLRPLHRGDPFGLQRAGLLVGVLGLVALFLLIEHVGDPVRAAMSVCVAAVLPILLLVQSMGVLYEELPAVLLITAATIIARRPDATIPPSPRRSLAAGAVAGLAFFANVKAVVVAVPLLAIALYESPVLRRTPWRACAAALLGGGLAIAPAVIAAIIDPQQGVGHEVQKRLWIAASQIDPRSLGTELFNLLVNAVDIGYYAEIVLGRDGRLWPATLAVSGAAFFYAALSVVRALRGRAYDRIAAACGALQLFFLVFVSLMYKQTVAGNYTPIAFSFAAAFGCTITAAAEWAARHRRSPRRWLAATAAIVIAILMTNTYRRLDIRDPSISTNINAVQALGAYLRDVSGRPIVVTSYNLVGLPEAFSGRSAVRLDLALGQCAGQPEEDACLNRVLVATIDALPEARFLVPLRTAVVDQPWERGIVPLLEGAAAGAGGHIREEAQFSTRHGVPVLALMEVDREATRSVSRRPSPR